MDFKNKIKGVILDMDGLMFDTEPFYHKSWSLAAAEQGVELGMDFFKKAVGRNNVDSESILMKHTDNKLDLKKFRVSWFKNWRALAVSEGIILKPGLVQLLKWLNSKKIPIAVATSSNGKILNLCLEISKLGRNFKATVNGEEIKKGKPNPDIYLKAAKRIGLKPAECIAVEDSEAGAEAALAAGMLVFIVPDHQMPSAEVRKRAYRVVPSLSMVLAVIKSLHAEFQFEDEISSA